MRPILLWHPDWIEHRVLAVDQNVLLGLKKDMKPLGYVGGVIMPMPPEGIRLEEKKLLLTPSYHPEFMPEIEVFSQLEHDLNTYVLITPAKKLSASIRALIRLASKLAVVESKKTRDIDAADGFRESATVEEKSTKTNIRRKWLIAWLWPRLDYFPPTMVSLTSKARADWINAYMAELGWADKITPGALRTEANRMELFIRE
jgi:hypothetical protein